MKISTQTQSIILAIVLVTAWYPAMAKDRIGVLVNDVTFKNIPTDQEKKYKVFSQVLAGQIQQVIGESPKFQVYTMDDFYTNLQHQLNVQRETCSANDKCIVKLMTNFGASDLVQAWVTILDGKYYVKITHSSNGEVVRSISGECPMTDPALSDKLKTLAADLFDIGPPSPQVHPGIQNLPVAAPTAVKPPTMPVVVTFRSDPPGAAVMVDGRMLCQDTSRNCTRNIVRGWHRIEMQKELYEPATERIHITKNTTIKLRLKPNFGTLTILSNPPNLPIKTNGKIVGDAPVRLKLAPNVRYTIDHASPCMYPSPKFVVMAKGQVREITLNPKPRIGWVQITAQDQSGNALTGVAFADGQELGPVPGNYQVSVCAKELEVVTANGKFSTFINPDPDQPVKVNAIVKRPRRTREHPHHAKSPSLVRDKQTPVRFLWQVGLGGVYVSRTPEHWGMKIPVQLGVLLKGRWRFSLILDYNMLIVPGAPHHSDDATRTALGVGGAIGVQFLKVLALDVVGAFEYNQDHCTKWKEQNYELKCISRISLPNSYLVGIRFNASFPFAQNTATIGFVLEADYSGVNGAVIGLSLVLGMPPEKERKKKK